MEQQNNLCANQVLTEYAKLRLQQSQLEFARGDFEIFDSLDELNRAATEFVCKLSEAE
ncbi:Uncharacterised protein [Moraxella caviae]|uniref:Uncharacterized protein n=1 Tax=Moraxella caviae TaxID=34060 RepID=A0A378R6F1_9GAMM|nr:hypothetical protein [Moraxella caviae]STZ13704.1 Uncharacterised protein [Moraxella caviae]